MSDDKWDLPERLRATMAAQGCATLTELLDKIDLLGLGAPLPTEGALQIALNDASKWAAPRATGRQHVPAKEIAAHAAHARKCEDKQDDAMWVVIYLRKMGKSKERDALIDRIAQLGALNKETP